MTYRLLPQKLKALAFSVIATCIACSFFWHTNLPAANLGWGLGLGTNGYGVRPHASINLFGGFPTGNRYQRAPNPTYVPRAVVVPSQPTYRVAPTAQPPQYAAPDNGHSQYTPDYREPSQRNHYRFNGRDYYR